MATSHDVRLAALLVVSAVAACGGEEVATREDHRAFQATERAVSGLSLARSHAGIFASWREETPDGDVLRWTQTESEEAPLHEVSLGRPSVAWELTPLLATGSGLIRMALDAGHFAELRTFDDGSVESYAPVYSLAAVSAPFRGVGLPSDAVVLAMAPDLTGVQLWVRVDVDWRVERLVGTAACVTNRAFALVPFAATALPDGSVALVSLESGDPGFCEPHLHVFTPGGAPDTPHAIRGSLLDPDTGDPAWAVADVVAVGAQGLGILWLSVDGRMRVSAVAPVGEVDFEAPAFDAGDQPVADARLLATNDRLIVTYRKDEDGVLSHTQAVVINPSGPSVSDVFRWPVDDAECSDLVAVPRGDGVSYACVSPCQGADCRERWLYRGRVVLPEAQ